MMNQIGLTVEAFPTINCDVCKQTSKGIKIKCGNERVNICQKCIDRWHKGVAGPFGERQLYSFSDES